jgi:hypothetical protein
LVVYTGLKKKKKKKIRMEAERERDRRDESQFKTKVQNALTKDTHIHAN